MLQVASAYEHVSHDFRRGHALDLTLKGARLNVILAAGEWSSPAFMLYLDLNKVSTEAVVEAHLEESDEE